MALNCTTNQNLKILWKNWTAHIHTFISSKELNILLFCYEKQALLRHVQAELHGTFTRPSQQNCRTWQVETGQIRCLPKTGNWSILLFLCSYGCSALKQHFSKFSFCCTDIELSSEFLQWIWLSTWTITVSSVVHHYLRRGMKGFFVAIYLLKLYVHILGNISDPFKHGW